MDIFANPIPFFFLIGLGAGLLKTDLRLPEAIYQIIGIYLLLAIGLKGGIELHGAVLLPMLPHAVGAMSAAFLIPLAAFGILRGLGRYSLENAAALAAHYGSVSAVTFAIAIAMLEREGTFFEPHVSVLLVLMEIPAIGVAILLYRVLRPNVATSWGELTREVFFNKSIYLLIAGLVLGAAFGPERLAPLNPVFKNAFPGLLAFFLLELGIVTSQRIADLRVGGWFLAVFAIGMPVLSALIGATAAAWSGMSPGGTFIVAVLSASASYIAAPAAMRIAIPDANPTLYLTASLGLTFPFNITVGIPLYRYIAKLFF